MFKKLKKWFLLGLLTITSGALIGTGISLANEDMTQTFASTLTGGEVLYLSPNDNWKADGARFAAYFFGSGDTWASMNECDNNSGIYRVIVPKGSWEKLIFCRMKSDSSANEWGNKWDQTNDLIFDGTNNLYTIAKGAWSNGNGTWSVFTEKEVLVGGQPIYLDVFSGWTSDNAQFGVYFYNKSGEDAYSEFLTKVEHSDGIVYEGVVPTGVWATVIAIRLNNTATSVSFDFKWNQTDNIKVIENMNVINVTDWGKDGKCGANAATTFTEESRAYCFSKYLISQTDSACENYETNTSSDYSTIWENLVKQFNNMHISAKNYLKNAVADKDEAEDEVKIAMARYDHIVAKYSLDNFLGRTEISLSSRLFANSINSNNSTLIIVLASITAIGLISVLFITFKRKRA